MSPPVLATLRTHYASLTPAEKGIADYVLSHGPEVVYMPITELSFRCSVGVTSIMRFCRRLGQSGYQAFRLELSSALEAERLQNDQNGAGDRSQFCRMMDSVYQKHVAALQSTRNLLKEETLGCVVRHLIDARQVYFFGLNHCLSTALGASQFLIAALHKGCCAMEPYSQQMLAETLTAQDAALFLSHNGSNERLLTIAQEAKATGAYTISITCNGDSPLSRLCHANLCCGCNVNPGEPSDLDKLTGKSAMAYLLEILCIACQDAFLYGTYLEVESDEKTAENSDALVDALPAVEHA